MNEQNQKPTIVRIHDVAVLMKKQRTNEDGTKRGYDFYAGDRSGVVIELSETTMTLKLANGETEVYDQSVIDKDYYYEVGIGSEIEYENLIGKEIKKQVKKIKEAEDELKDLNAWYYEFKERISLWGRLMRYLKQQ